MIFGAVLAVLDKMTILLLRILHFETVVLKLFINLAYEGLWT